MGMVATDMRAKRRRRKEARPQELLEAAFHVFLDKGYAAARLDDIAMRAGVSKGTVYLYFDSKEAVFQEMVRRVADAQIERVSNLVDQHQGSFAVLIRQLARFASGFVQTEPLLHLPRLIIGESARFPELAKFYFETAISRGRGLLMRIIERGQASGEFRAIPPRHAAHLLISPFLFMAIYKSVFERHEGIPFDAEGHLAAHLDNFLRGLCVETPQT